VTVDNGDEVTYLAAPGSEWRPDQADWSGQDLSVTTSSTFGIVKAANNEPRFDHDPVTLACKGLLIEEGRTNICRQSENFGTTWITYFTNLIYLSQVAPNGNPSAYSLVEDTSTTPHAIYQSIAFAGTTNYTFSVFVKAGSRNFASLVEQSSGGAVRRTFFNLSTGEVGTKNASHTASTQQLPNGWWRLIISFTSGAASSNNIAIELASADNVSSYLGNGSGNVFIWGAQLEVGSFPTSYIPTTTGSVVRSADVCSITTAGWSNAGNDTMVAEYFVRNFLSGSVVLEGSPAISWMSVSFLAVNQQRNLYRHGGTINRVDAVSGTDSVSLTSINKTALTSGEQIALNGSLSQTLFGDPTQADISTSLSIGSRGNGASAFLNGHIAAIRYYKKRLPDAKLVTLTT
jgi:hypothetical protein